jgi:hypothetical protein
MNRLKKNQENNSIHNSLKKKIKYLSMNLTKKVNDLCNESYKPLKKETEDNRRWKDLPFHGSAELIL